MSSMTNQSLPKGPQTGYSGKKATDLNAIATPNRPKTKHGRKQGVSRGSIPESKLQQQPAKDVVADATDSNAAFMKGEKVNKAQLLSDSKEFVCNICCEHVVGASPVLTRCSHLFCGDCFDRWAEVCPVQQSWAQKARKANNGERTVPCPVCEESLDVPRDLDEVCKESSQSANLVLWRMLYSVKVCCKNNPQYAGKGGSCNWVGDYGNYQKHVENCSNVPVTNAKEADNTDSTTSGSPASSETGSSSAESPQLSPNVSNIFREARSESASEEGKSVPASAKQECVDNEDFLQAPPGLEKEESLPEWATPPGLEEEESMPEWADADVCDPPPGLEEAELVPEWLRGEEEQEEELPEWAADDVTCAPEWSIEPNQVQNIVSTTPVQMPACDVALETQFVAPPQWSPRVTETATDSRDPAKDQGSSLEERSVEESELPSNSLAHLMSLLSQIDEEEEDDNKITKCNEHPKPEEKASTGASTPPITTPKAVEMTPTPPPPPAAAAPTVLQQPPPPPPSTVPAEMAPAPVQLEQLLPPPSQPAPQNIPARTPQVIPARMPPANLPAHTSQMPMAPSAAMGLPLPPAPGLMHPSRVAAQPGAKQPIRGPALFSFNPTEVGHIPVQQGEPIEIYEYHPSGWCHCRSLARPTQRSGWVPTWILPPPKMDAPPPAPMTGMPAQPVSAAPGLPPPMAANAPAPGMPPMPMPMHAPPSTMAPQNFPAQPPQAPPAEAFPAAPGLTAPPAGMAPATAATAAAANSLPPPPPGICAPPSEPPSTKMPCAPAPTQPVVEVRHEYASTGPSFISLAPRDLVEIFRRDASGWAYGRKVGSAGKQPEGWFPAWVCAH